MPDFFGTFAKCCRNSPNFARITCIPIIAAFLKPIFFRAHGLRRQSRKPTEKEDDTNIMMQVSRIQNGIIASSFRCCPVSKAAPDQAIRDGSGALFGYPLPLSINVWEYSERLVQASRTNLKVREILLNCHQHQ